MNIDDNKIFTAAIAFAAWLLGLVSSKLSDIVKNKATIANMSADIADIKQSAQSTATDAQEALRISRSNKESIARMALILDKHEDQIAQLRSMHEKLDFIHEILKQQFSSK